MTLPLLSASVSPGSHSLILCGLCYQQGRSVLQNVPGLGWRWTTRQWLGREINAGTRIFESVTEKRKEKRNKVSRGSGRESSKGESFRGSGPHIGYQSANSEMLECFAEVHVSRHRPSPKDLWLDCFDNLSIHGN